jgi:hypothetical protein
MLVDAWMCQLLTSHLPLMADDGETYRAEWVLSPRHVVKALPYGPFPNDFMAPSDFHRLAIVVACVERGTCDSLDCCWANPLRFIAIDCGPAVDGRQPADLNGSSIVEFSFNPSDHEVEDIDVSEDLAA